MKPRFATALFLAGSLLIVVAGRTAASDPPKRKYVFVENTDRWVGIVIGDSQLIGKLDKHGDFMPEIKLKRGQGSTLLPPHVIINSSLDARRPKEVYEFRSKVLIPGELRPDGQFVPEAGGKIIPFEDYEYSPTATPIWNLPGVFLTKAEAAKLKNVKPADKN